MEISGQPPLALIGCSEMWMSHALESVFEEKGYVVALTRSAAQTIRLALRTSHDVIVVDETLDDSNAVAVCRALRDDAQFDHSTPIVITSPQPVSRGYRLSAFAAGAWEYCSNPIDFEAMFFKLGTFIRARRELAVAQSESFVDQRTGLYSSFGLQHLAGQLSARAVRKHEPFACVAISPQPRGLREERVVGLDSISGFADVASVFRAQSRKSDIVGVMGESRVAILAPDTNAEGARLLVARMQNEFDKASRSHAIGGPIRLRAGYSAVADLATANVSVEELVHRAELALNRIPERAVGDLVIEFEDLTPPE
jgi:DNA-binding response OmpR family regulator